MADPTPPSWWTPPTPASWIAGNARWDTTTVNLERGTLSGYLTTKVFRCPGDRSRVEGKPQLLRTRSYMLSLGLNGNDPNDYPSTRAVIRKKSSQLSRPSPDKIWAFVDGSEGTILGGAFWMWPLGQPDQYRDYWLVQPSDRHNMGANLSFADGHVDRQPWRRPKRLGPGKNERAENDLDLQDLRWLQAGLPEP